MKLIVEVEIGNDAMKLPTHLADAVAAVAKQIPHVVMMKGSSTKIKDINGNVVGSWSYK